MLDLKMPVGALIMLAMLLLSGPVASKDEVDIEGAQLVDLASSGIDNVGTFCSVINQVVKRSINVRDYIEGQQALEQEEKELYQTYGEIFFESQQSSGVSFDDIDSTDVAAFMISMQGEYDQFLRQGAVNLSDTPEKVEEKWSSFDIARTTLSVASIADPSGIIGVGAAYTYPTCDMNEAQTGIGGFCWKNSEGRGVGTLPSSLGRVADCPEGYTNTGFTCHPNKEDIFVQPSRPANCPEGYTNNGATCGRGGASYPQASRVADCPEGYTNNGLTCGRGGGSYPQGSRSADCPSGYTNNGLTCGRGGSSYPQGSRVADCPAGYTNNGLTCGRTGNAYPQGSRVADCPKGYTNNGLTCGQNGDTYAQGSRVADCPAGYTNNGLTCGRGGETYGKGCTTVFKTFPCRSGYTDTGCTCTKWPSTLGLDSMSCKAGEFRTFARCYRSCRDGYTNIGELCSKPPSTLGLGAMSCTGNENFVAGRCYKPCRAGYTNIGELCTSISTLGLEAMTCSGDETKVGGRCYKPCRSGYTNIGEVCTEVSTLGMDSMICNADEFKTGARCYKNCREGFTNIGELCTEVSTLGLEAMSCGVDEFRTLGRCYSQCREGYTNIGELCTEVSTLGIDSMSCNADEFRTLARCYQPCPDGYTNTGEFCQKSILGVPSMICKSSEVKDGARCYPADACPDGKNLQNALCYRSCSDTSAEAIGPVCWGACQGRFATPCGAGCATSELECALATTDMIASPVEVVVSIASLGSYSSASSARKAASLAARKAASAVASEVAKASAKKAGRQLAREALEKLSRQTVNQLQDDLVQALIQRGDDLLVEEGREIARAVYKRILESPTDNNTITDLERLALKHFGDDVISEVVQQSEKEALQQRLNHGLRIAKEQASIDDAKDLAKIDPGKLQRISDAMISSTRRSAERIKHFKNWLKDNKDKFVQAAKDNVYKPLTDNRVTNSGAGKAIANNVPTKKNLRKKSEILDIFFEQKEKFGSNKFIATVRASRICAKAGLNAAINAIESAEQETK